MNDILLAILKCINFCKTAQQVDRNFHDIGK